MKKFYFLFCIFSLLLFSFQQTRAQKLTYTTRGGISLGFGIGGVYQQSDIANSSGVGYDFTFGTPIYRREGAFLAADWKFRFLAGENKAFDHRINADGTYSNIDYKFFSYDLELGFILNRLRERTRIVVSGFAGAGITHGRTFTDLYDADNILYDFSGIDPGRERRQISDDLLSLSDNDFETRLVNKASVLPTAGLYIGYQFTPSFSLGIEHKTNFSLSEENSTFGINMDNRVISGSLFDMNHYTTLCFVWKLGRTSGGGGRTEHMLMPDTPDVLTGPATPLVTEALESPASTMSPQPPSVKITSPGTDPYTSSSGYVLIRADVRNVNHVDDISFFLENERVSDFSYNDYSNAFSAMVELQEGENRFRVRVANGNGSSEDRIVVIYQKRDPVRSPVVTQANPIPPSPSAAIPVVTQTNPIPPSPSSVIPVVTQTYPVTQPTSQPRPQPPPPSQPRPQPQPQPPPRQPVVVPPPVPAPAPCLEPVIRLSSAEHISTPNARYVFTAGLENISERSQVRLSFNGQDVLFDFNGRTIIYSASLTPGPNRFSLTAINDCGRDSRTVIVNADISSAVPCASPLTDVNIIPLNRADGSYELKGKIRNVVNKSGITLMVDGQNTRDFYFTPSTGAISARFNFSPGTHTIIVSSRNDCGYDTRSLSVAVAEPCQEPTLEISIRAVNNSRATHELTGTVRNIVSKENISMKVNGTVSRDFQFVPGFGSVSAQLNLNPGTHTVELTVGNDCGYDTKTQSIVIEEPEKESNCGTRINPGNSDWQFCLVTPRGTYNRSNLKNMNFSYSGPASSLYILPTAGGGSAIVNGKDYPLKSGQYYFFTGNLKVQVISSHPGAMGQWWVCVESDRAPASGNGNQRPKSPCER